MPSIASRITWQDQEQKHSCGPASIKMALSVFGISRTESAISQEAGLTSDGLPHDKMVRYIKDQGLFPIAFSDADISQINTLVGLGLPVIVNYNNIPRIYTASGPGGHYAVVASIDKSSVTLADPAEGPEHVLTIDDFVKNWFDEGPDGNRWFCAVSKVPLELLIEYASRKDKDYQVQDAIELSPR